MVIFLPELNMARRNDTPRRRLRRERKLRELQVEERASEELRLNPSPINWSRLYQTFASMSFRSNVRGGARPFEGFVLGPHVVASNPKELVEKTEEFSVVSTLGKPEN